MKSTCLIVNPIAGRHKGWELANLASRALGSASMKVKVLTPGPGSVSDIAHCESLKADQVVVIGGDGTVREAVEGIVRSKRKIPIGIIPAGNTNVIARDLDIPLNPKGAIETIHRGDHRYIDLGKANGKPFVAMVGIGFDAQVATLVQAFRLTRVGRQLHRSCMANIMYGVGILGALGRLDSFSVEMEVDGIRQGKFGSVVVSNTETYAIGWKATPGASSVDGFLDHHAQRGSARYRSLLCLACIALRKRAPEFIASYGLGERYIFKSQKAFPWHLDGDAMPPVPELSLEVLKNHITIVAPCKM